MKTTAICNAATIWDYDSTLPDNHIFNDSLDVVATIRTLAVKIQASKQWISYFNHLQAECSVENTLAIPLHSKIC